MQESNTYVVADSYQDRVCTFDARGAHLFTFPPGAGYVVRFGVWWEWITDEVPGFLD